MQMDRQTGIEAIIYLQAMAGIKESQEAAARGWDGMSVSDQVATISTYALFKEREV